MAHSVAWHPTSREGIFAVAAGAARVVIRSAATRRALGAAWLVDPFPARAVAVAFSSVPAPEPFPDEADTEDAGGMLLAVGTADGDVRLFRLTRRRRGVEGEECEGEGRDGESERFARDDDGGADVADDELASARCVARVKSCDGPITALAFSPDGARLAVGSEDRAVSVHVVSRPGKDGEVCWLPSRVRCKGHAAAILAADWSPDSATLRTSSRAHEIIHFDARTGRQAIGDFRDAEWREWTSPVGFQAMGVFQNGGLAGHEVNTACRAGARRLLAAGDDFGRVRVLRWPCVAPNAPAAEQTEAHANHVSCVRFSPTRGERVARLHRREGQRRAPMARRGRNRDGRGDARGRRRGIANLEDEPPRRRRGAIVDGIVPAEDEEVYEHEEEEEDAGGRRLRRRRRCLSADGRLARWRTARRAWRSWTRRCPRCYPPRDDAAAASRATVGAAAVGAPAVAGRGRATPEPKPPTPEREGERLEYVDGEYRWTDAPGTNERASGREGA